MATQGVNIIRLHQIYNGKRQKFPMNIHSNVLSVTHLIFPTRCNDEGGYDML